MGEHGLMRDAMVYLAAAIVFVPIASRLRLGSVLGYLVAGCVIGPFGLGLVRDVQSILHFAEFGFVLMLFGPWATVKLRLAGSGKVSSTRRDSFGE